ncbi:MAG: transglutaminaseTgpA domain-containing protein [Propionibacteriaceae bacterium]
MRTTDRSQVAVTVAVLLSALTLRPLTSDMGYVSTGFVLVVALALLSAVLRRVRISESFVLLAQLVVWAGAVLFLAATLPGPGDTWYGHLIGLFADGAAHMQTQSAPMSPNGGVRLMLVGAVGLIMILTDLLVLGAHRAAWSIAPLSTLFLIPAIGLPVDSGAAAFLAIVIGYLGILVADGLNRTSRWTRGLSRDSAGGVQTTTSVVWRSAAYIGVPTVVLALVVAPLVPTISLDGLGIGSGSGRGGPLQLADPTLDLRRNLHQPANQEVITYRTSNGQGEYLRMASLPALSKDGWQNNQFPLLDQLPAIPGVSSEPTERVRSSIRVDRFSAQYLPLPYAPRSFEANGDWGVDPASLVVVSKNSATTLAGLSYTAESVVIQPTSAELATTTAGNPADADTTAVQPSDLPQEIVDLTDRVIAGQTTDAGKAAAIQAFLRSSEFTYSTEPQPGTGYQALVNFLTKDKKGYCEQFAGAMSAMARVAKIPSRVAVGFLPGKKDGDTWRVAIRDMHAWPELYFAGYGWVRYEPTPSVASAPAWTVRPAAQNTADPSTPPSASSSAEAPSSRPSAGQDPAQQQTTTTKTTDRGWARSVGLSLAGLLVLVVLALPATIRVRRRSVRLADDEPADVRVEGAWAEVRDTVVDLGGRWPDGSARHIGAEVADRLDTGPSTQMSQLATLVERSRYSRALGEAEVPPDLADVTTQIRKGLAGNRSRRQRLLAVVAPRSVRRAVLERFRRR